MYGANPAIFKKFDAAMLAAKAYTLEDGNVPWTVFEKHTEHQVWYKPVKMGDHAQANQDGYAEVKKCKFCMREQSDMAVCPKCTDYLQESETSRLE